MQKVEFHCHTCHSKDSLVKIEVLAVAARKKGLDRIVITDHNAIQGAFEAQAIDPGRFIVGEEIMTKQGELIGIFMGKYVPHGLTARETISLLRTQGAFITVAHPFDTLRKGHWEDTDLLNILPYIDAIEVFNSRCMDPHANLKAQKFAQKYKLLATVGSDSHSIQELGTATLTIPDFNDAITLKRSLTVAQINARLSPPWVHLYSRYAAWRKKIS